MKQTAFIVIVVGLILTFVTAFTFFTKEKVVDLGQLQISREKPHYLNWSPLVGIAVIGLGGALFWQSYRKG
jgi:hypothetical protein